MDGTNEWIDGPLPPGRSLVELRDLLPMTGPADEVLRREYAKLASDWVDEQVEKYRSLAGLRKFLTTCPGYGASDIRTGDNIAFIGAMFRGLHLAEVQRREPVDPAGPEPEGDPTMDEPAFDAKLSDGPHGRFLMDQARLWVGAERKRGLPLCELRQRLTTFTGHGELDVHTESDISRVGAMIRGLHFGEVLRRELVGNP